MGKGPLRWTASLALSFLCTLTGIHAQHSPGETGASGPASELQRRAEGRRFEIPFRFCRDYLIVVGGSVKGSRLRLLIDTGSEYSVVDRRVAKRLRLTSIAQTVRLNSFGKASMAKRVILAGLQLGPMMTSLVCLEKDISFNEFDVILGLDLLRRYGQFSVDFRAGKIVFGPIGQLESVTTMEPDSRMIIVQARIGDRPIRLSMDTGSETLCLYAGAEAIRAARVLNHPQYTIVHAAGETAAYQVSVYSLLLGGNEWRNLYALAFETPKPRDRDGTLGVACLGLRRIQFDFERNLVSWDK